MGSSDQVIKEKGNSLDLPCRICLPTVRHNADVCVCAPADKHEAVKQAATDAFQMLSEAFKAMTATGAGAVR